MYHLNDTIAAVSSPGNDHRVIVRLTGSKAVSIINQIFTPAVSGKPGITSGKILNLESTVYLFRQPHSYTGDDLAEIHIWANPAVTETLIEKLLALGARVAGAGEFTARAYLNGKINLAQAEAVNEVITSSNTFQLAAAENLLAGQLGRTKEKISSSILDILCLLEAGLDFGTEDIEPGNRSGEITALSDIINQLREQVASSVSCESTIDLPAVGIAGAPNAGKSTLLNKLLGRQRSIVSHQRKTTRDVLTGELVLHDCRCVLFDCAGLITHAETILDELAQTAAIEALKNAIVVIFCVDTSKPDWTEDLEIRQLVVNPGTLIPVATKADLLSEKEFSERTLKLKSLFGCEFLPISAHSEFGFNKLKTEIAGRIITATSGYNKEGVALTARHRQALNNAIHDIVQAEKEIKAGNDEIACMMLRTAHNQLSNIEQHNIDEQVLDRIFSRFCIGK
jgi:tRNA modification GTPase